jgi:hypothetical protein
LLRNRLALRIKRLRNVAGDVVEARIPFQTI